MSQEFQKESKPIGVHNPDLLPWRPGTIRSEVEDDVPRIEGTIDGSEGWENVPVIGPNPNPFAKPPPPTKKRSQSEEGGKESA